MKEEKNNNVLKKEIIQKNQKGITLLALIITIILLLIVSGVTLNVALGDNGLLKKSKEAINKSKLAQREDAIKMDLLAAYIDAELVGLDKPSNEIIREIVENHGGTIDVNNPNIILTPDGEIRLDEVLNDASSGTENPEEINKTIIELNKQISDLKGELNKANTDKQTLQDQVTELNRNITELNTQVASWKKKAEDGEITISEKDAQISGLNEQIISKSQEIEEKQNRIQELEGNVTTLTNEKQSLETHVATLNTRVAELEGKQATGDALESDVLEGKTFSNGSGVNLTGTMANRGTLNFNPTESITQELQPGYYNGGTISSIGAYEAGKQAGRMKINEFHGLSPSGETRMLGDITLYIYRIKTQIPLSTVEFAKISHWGGGTHEGGTAFVTPYGISTTDGEWLGISDENDERFIKIDGDEVLVLSNLSYGNERTSVTIYYYMD